MSVLEIIDKSGLFKATLGFYVMSLSWVRYHLQLSFNFIILARFGGFHDTAILN